jgi:uncharacterized repeat protein (TIGR01451 family)
MTHLLEQVLTAARNVKTILRASIFILGTAILAMTPALPAHAAAGDFDNDGIPDSIDLDDDNDGIPDTDEGLSCPSVVSNEFGGTFGTRTQAQGARNLQDPTAANASGYSYTGNGGAAARYSVISQAGPGINAWWGGSGLPNLAGHTTGQPDDAYLAVNGSTTQGVFYQETVNITPGSDLSLSLRGANWSSSPQYPVVAMRAYDSTGTVLLGSANTPQLLNSTWVKSELNFNAGSNSQIIIRLMNLTTAGGGNDFAIDDFALRTTGGPACTARDTDGDGHPDYQDIDSDNDGITDNRESQGTTYRVPANRDRDADGLDDAYDNVCSLQDVGGAAGNTDECTTAGFVAGTIITPVDTDGDGRTNQLDLDSDGDGIPDNNEGQSTTGYTPPSGADTNADGLDDAYGFGSGGVLPVNTDGADTPDYLDLDSDNEGGNDTVEAGLTLTGTDSDHDGLDDAVDTTPDYTDPNGTINMTAQLPNNEDASTVEVDFRDPVQSAVTAHKSADRANAKPGEKITYTVTVSNAGPGTAGNVSILDTLADVIDDADYNNDAVVTGAGSVAYTSPMLFIDAPSIPAGGSITVTYSVTVKNPRPASANHQAVNRVIAPNCPETSTDPGCVTTTNITAAPKLVVSKTAPTTPLHPGDTLRYDVVAKNEGDGPAMGYQLIDNLVNAIDDANYNNDAVASAGQVSYNDPIISWSGDLQPGDEVHISYSVTVPQQSKGGNGFVVNSIIDPEVLSNCPESSTDPMCTVTTPMASNANNGSNSGANSGLANTGSNWLMYLIGAAVLAVVGAVIRVRRTVTSV